MLFLFYPSFLPSPSQNPLKTVSPLPVFSAFDCLTKNGGNGELGTINSCHTPVQMHVGLGGEETHIAFDVPMPG